MSEKYRIHDNGGRPFEVSIDRTSQAVDVRKHREHDDDECGDNCVYDPLTSWRFRGVWIGQGTDCPDEDQGASTFGNTVLVEPIPEGADEKNPVTKLVIIQGDIRAFELKEADEVVTRFSSRIRNSDVPFPYIETNKNVYLTLENVYAPFAPLVQLAEQDAKARGQILNPDYTRTELVTGPTWDSVLGRVVEKTEPMIFDFYDLYYRNKDNALWSKFPTHVIQQRT